MIFRRKKKNLNEDALKTALDADVADELQAVVTPVYAKAIEDHKEAVKNKEEVMKERTGEPIKQPKEVSTDAMKKMHLSESLFEGKEDAEDDDLFTFLYQELIQEHHVKPTLDLPGVPYAYEVYTDEIGLSADTMIKLGANAADDTIIGIRATYGTDEQKRAFLDRIRELAKRLELDYNEIDDRGDLIGAIVLDNEAAQSDYHDYLD